MIQPERLEHRRAFHHLSFEHHVRLNVQISCYDFNIFFLHIIISLITWWKNTSFLFMNIQIRVYGLIFEQTMCCRKDMFACYQRSTYCTKECNGYLGTNCDVQFYPRWKQYIQIFLPQSKDMLLSFINTSNAIHGQAPGGATEPPTMRVAFTLE